MKQLPEFGRKKDDLLKQLDEAKKHDANWKNGRTWSLVYYAGEEITEISKEAYMKYFHENGLNPMAFPSLRRFETEVLSMTASLFNGDDQTVGSLTSGGTESILMAVKTYRDYARKMKPEILEPEMILPISVHAAFEKAAHYFNVKPIHIPLTDDFRADVKQLENAITKNTILIVGSAPSYPHGVIDPIEKMADIASMHNIPFHVDACLGGFLLPFLQKLDYEIPPFDFRVPGVTSISADIHKYGYAAKGVSTILYKNDSYRKHQYFAYSDWPGGLFVSPTATGTRPGGAIASAWAVMNYIGMDGYINLAKKTMEITKQLLNGIRTIDELKILGNPDASVFTIASEEVNVYALADRMEQLGWHIDRQQFPACLHFMVTPAHEQIVETFLSDLKRAVKDVKENPEKFTEGSAAMYGMAGTIPDRSEVNDYLVQTLDQLMRLEN
ncbi:pyridoxal phosphate-dependent decarboxylase family protein [Fervidibacillus halotolerans]|uniref:Aspartate aminotransferase family protein n=1 Tax=Fervidibacillus halotolerans TaxID=2980027 RepID=A0A9E8M244_9BACI|nr:aspartate aminotransferase family protein [Fervidibacillus halotolerans]WAA12894.1 aspartate aminotransferase family protein [Fervidibacillus halotolerans]